MGEFDARPLQRQAGFLEAQEVLPFRGLFIGGNVASRSPELLGRASHILAVNGMSPLDAVAKVCRGCTAGRAIFGAVRPARMCTAPVSLARPLARPPRPTPLAGTPRCRHGRRCFA
jgi:hypothetical protein